MSEPNPMRMLLDQILMGRLNRRQALTRAAALGITPLALSHAMTQVVAAQEMRTVAFETIPGPPWEGGTRGGTGRVAWPEDTITLDPPLAYDLGGYYGIANFYRGLLYYGLNTEPQLDLRRVDGYQRGRLRLPVPLKPGVTFHNGRELTAHDFKFTWERASSPDIASWVQGFLGSVEGHADFVAGDADEITGIKVVDDLTIELTLTSRTSPSLASSPSHPSTPCRPRRFRPRAKLSSSLWEPAPGRWRSLTRPSAVYRCSRFENYVYADRCPTSTPWSGSGASPRRSRRSGCSGAS